MVFKIKLQDEGIHRLNCWSTDTFASLPQFISLTVPNIFTSFKIFLSVLEAWTWIVPRASLTMLLDCPSAFKDYTSIFRNRSAYSLEEMGILVELSVPSCSEQKLFLQQLDTSKQASNRMTYFNHFRSRAKIYKDVNMLTSTKVLSIHCTAFLLLKSWKCPTVAFMRTRNQN